MGLATRLDTCNIVVRLCVSRAERLGSNSGGYYNLANFSYEFCLAIFANSETEPVAIPFVLVFGLFEGLAYFFGVFIVNKKVSWWLGQS